MAFTAAAIMNLIHLVNGVIDRDNRPENLDASESNDLVCVESLVDALTGAGKIDMLRRRKPVDSATRRVLVEVGHSLS